MSADTLPESSDGHGFRRSRAPLTDGRWAVAPQDHVAEFAALLMRVAGHMLVTEVKWEGMAVRAMNVDCTLTQHLTLGDGPAEISSLGSPAVRRVRWRPQWLAWVE